MSRGEDFGDRGNRRERRGKWAYYRLVPDTLDALAGLITSPASTAMAAE